ncbi:glycoside hydrolase family 39 protein [Ilyonectria destructans]|nr:glycoside hydrolase family 39 protein [Ilyonectria destructans]
MHIHTALEVFVLALAAGRCHGAPGSQIAKRAVLGTATVNLAIPQGTPSHYASGFIYGIPDTPNQIPDHFYTDIGFRYTRAGGSQLPAPARGWVYGNNEFQNRFNSALSNYKTARQHGARFQLLVADLWGADGTAKIAMPGDNGDWASFDQFLNTLFASITGNNMIDGLDFETWNEPDLTGVFWQRDQAQYLQMWAHAYPRIRAALPNTPIVGPCSSSQPSTSNSWYAQYYPFVLSNHSVPDIYCWHEEASGDDVARDIQNNAAALSHYGLPANPVIINEYGVLNEQNPGSSAWYISRLERYNTTGLRGNWASGYSLHDYFGNLLGKPGATQDCTSSACNTTAGYWGNGEYNVYKYYNLNMTGQRVQTIGSPDNLFDIYATRDGKKSVKMLCGSRLTSGTWDILVTGLDAIGLPSAGTITIQAYQFNYVDGQFGNVPAPVNQGTYPHTYSGNQLVFYVSPDTTTGYAFEFVL